MNTYVRRPTILGSVDSGPDGWTDARLTQVRDMWPDGWSASQISDRIGGGLTKNAVIGQVHRLGLSRPEKSPSSGKKKVRKPAGPSAGAAPTSRIPPPEQPAPQPLTAKRNRPRGDNGGGALTRINAGAVTASVKARARREQLVEENVDGPFVCDGVMELPPDESPYAVSLLDAREHHCRFPIGNPFQPSFRFCGSRKLVGSSYCRRHFIRCTRESDRDRRRELGHRGARAVNTPSLTPMRRTS